MKRAPHVELRVAPQRTPYRLDFGLAELVRPVALRRSDGKPSTSAAACAKAKKAASGTGSSTTIAKFRCTDSGPDQRLTNYTAQPNKNKRYQMSSNVPLIIIFVRLFRGGRTAHNGLAGLLKWRRYPVSGTTLSVSTNPIVPNAARTVGQQRRDRESEPHHDENQTAPRPRRPTRSRPVRG